MRTKTKRISGIYIFNVYINSIYIYIVFCFDIYINYNLPIAETLLVQLYLISNMYTFVGLL